MDKVENNNPYSLEEIVRLYPLLYSQKRFDEWSNLFDERAMVIRIEKGEPIACVGIHNALPEHKEYACRNELFIEMWNHVEIKRYSNIALIKADYHLATDHEVRKGVDLLTLTCEGDSWHIISLVYEQTEFIQR